MSRERAREREAGSGFRDVRSRLTCGSSRRSFRGAAVNGRTGAEPEDREAARVDQHKVSGPNLILVVGQIKKVSLL